MKAADAVAGYPAGGPEDRSDQPVCGFPGDTSTVAAGTRAALQVAHEPRSAGLSTSSTPDARRPGTAPHRFNLSFPFPTPLEAEIACGSLAPDAEPHGGVVGKELTVSGSTLAVNWTAEDSRLLRISIINFLEQLSLVVRTIQRFGPPVSR